MRRCCPIIFTSFPSKSENSDPQWVLISENAPAVTETGSARPHALQDCGAGHFKTQKTRMNLIPTLTPTGNIRRGVALLGQWNQVAWNEMSPESGAAYQLIWTGQKTVSCGRKIKTTFFF